MVIKWYIIKRVVKLCKFIVKFYCLITIVLLLLCSDHAEDGMDLFEVTIRDLFNSADIEGKGVITRENFVKVIYCDV